VRSIGQALLGRALSADRPVLILSGNDVEHALLSLACLHVGLSYAPVSPAHSLLSADMVKLRQIGSLTTPGLVFVSDAAAFGRALDALTPHDAEIVAVRNGRPGNTPFTTLMAEIPGPAVDLATGRVTGDTVAKLLFTSGSTGNPKAVINTTACCAPTRP